MPLYFLQSTRILSRTWLLTSWSPKIEYRAGLILVLDYFLQSRFKAQKTLTRSSLGLPVLAKKRASSVDQFWIGVMDWFAIDCP